MATRAHVEESWLRSSRPRRLAVLSCATAFDEAERAAIASLGAGRMGRGIAVAFAYAGHPVTLVDFKPRDAASFARLAAEATDEVRGTLTSLARFGLFDDGQGRPHRGARGGRARSGAPGGALVRSGDLRRHPRGARSQARGAGARVGACRPAADHRLDHIDDPGRRSVGRGRASGTLPQRPLAQSGLSRAAGRAVARAKHTDPAVTARLKALLEGIGKVPVVCAPRPGYIVPRIQALAMNEAARMVEEGVASRRGYRQGDQVRLRLPLRGARHAGVHRLGRRRHSLLRQPLSHAGARQRALRRARDRRAQHDGKAASACRTGAGFLDYEGLDVDAYRRERLKAFVAMLGHFGLSQAAGRGRLRCDLFMSTERHVLPSSRRCARPRCCRRVIVVRITGMSKCPAV